MKCLKMPELEKTALVSPWDLTELSLIPRTKIITLQGKTDSGKSSWVAELFRNNRKNKVMLLEKPWIPLCSPVCYRGKQLSKLSYSTLGWDGQCSPLVSVHRTCSNSKRNYSFRSKNHTVYNKISPLIILLAYVCNLPPPR